MPSQSILISGPAGTGKTQEALKRLGHNKILADFTAQFNAIRGVRRDPSSGRFPVRGQAESGFLPLTEQMRREVIRRGRRHGFSVITTNSNGDPAFRRRLLELLGPGAREIILDPGREEVVERLKDKATGILDPECEKAANRWYSRINAARG